MGVTSKNGQYLSIVTSGFLIAIWIDAPLVNFVRHITDWRTVFVLLSISTLMVCILIRIIFSNFIKGESSSHLTLEQLKFKIVHELVTTFWAFAVYGVYTFLGYLFKCDGAFE